MKTFVEEDGHHSQVVKIAKSWLESCRVVLILWTRFPSGYGHEREAGVSQIRVQMPLKIRRVEVVKTR
ncbi:hypothetical protein TNCV_2127241 [Trichonephila clavipes]|nr:hypothetical protein TNCV_2127241 [Trichonephila clavipes]